MWLDFNSNFQYGFTVLAQYNKDLFVSSIFTMALRAIVKKTKINKNIEIYQYITVNNKNVATKIVKRPKTDSDRKTKVKAR